MRFEEANMALETAQYPGNYAVYKVEESSSAKKLEEVALEYSNEVV